MDSAPDQLVKEIQHANNFGDQIENLVLAKEHVPTGDRNTLLMAYWSLAFELHRGILALIDHKFYGPSFALVRPIIETAVRAHVVLFCTEDVLKTLHDDTYRTNLATVGKEIDAAFGLDGFFENFLNQARKALHSYTHAGLSRWEDGSKVLTLPPTMITARSSRSFVLLPAACSW